MRYALLRTCKQVALAAATVCAVALAGQGTGSADEAGAKAMVKAMSDFLAGQKNISAKYNTELEIVTPSIEKITFSSTGELTLSRPDKIHATRTGGYADVELFFDGKTFSLYGKHVNSYVRVEVPGMVDNLIDVLREKHGAQLPFADLLLSKPYDVLMDGVLEAKDVGRGVIDGVECEHLAFRAFDTDWQLWVQTGPQPVPRQYIITSKTIAGAPQYRIRLTEWKTDAAPASAAFTFKPPEGAKLVAADAIKEFDELPPPAETQGKK